MRPATETDPILLPERCDDQFLRDMIAYDFGGHGGGARLARRLGIAESTASALRHGEGDLTKVGALYGYKPSPDADDLWLKQMRRLDPKKAGRLRWTPEIDERIRLAIQQLDDLRALAIELGTTKARLLDRITRKQLRKPLPGSFEEAREASRQRMIARLEAIDRSHFQRAALQQEGVPR